MKGFRIVLNQILPIVAVIGIITTCSSPSALADGGTPTPDPGPAGAIVGHITDAETGQPLGWVTVILPELRRGEVAHPDGSFHFYDVPVGSYSLKVSYLGYQTQIVQVTVKEHDTTRVNLKMTPTPLQGTHIVITADKDAAKRTVYDPTEVLSGSKLQQQLGRTLAETLGSEAGVAQRTMGPAAARPVVRGLGGDRLLILQDGERTGDLSASSADHAVAIDPMNADRIEIVQGPAAFLYSSNALGGVVNLVEDRIAPNLPDRVHGEASIQGESVNTGISGGLSLHGPAGPIALQLQASGRHSDDISTPIGTLDNTALTTYSGSLGGSYVGSSGFAGLAGGIYHTRYGVPTEFPGGEEGVHIVIDKKDAQAKGEYVMNGDLFKRLEVNGSYTDYNQQELEEDGAIGTEFHVNTANLTAMLHHDTLGIFHRGTIGIWGERRDFTAGETSSVPATVEQGIAGMLYEEKEIGGLNLRAGLRYDFHQSSPDSLYTSEIGSVRERTFGGFSGSIGATYDLGAGLEAGLTLTRTFRSPTVEELYSDGLHLAAYSYEVGNPDLGAERGFGSELALRYASNAGHLSVALFRNALDAYVYSRNTGDTNAATGLPIYQTTGGNALMVGGEFSGEYEIAPKLVLAATLSYVEGTLRETDQPLPMMPPLNGKIDARYQLGDFTFGVATRGAARQDRVDEFEEPTAGYVVFDAFAQYRYTTSTLLHTIVLTGENLADTEYRQHLSRIKAIMPEPGRNIKLFYRLYF